MASFDGAAALKLDFGATTTTGSAATAARGGRGSLRLAPQPATLTGPDKYKVLEHRRRQAQIRARHLLDLMEEAR